MSTSDNKNFNDQEIDLGILFKKVSGFFQSINQLIFLMIQFVLKHIIVLSILAVLGVGIGLYLNKTNKIYTNEIIVHPNFESTDYAYSKIELLESKIKDHDTLFLKSIGIEHPAHLRKITITPVIDIYKFISSTSTKDNDQSFQILKLMSEDGDMKKIIDEETTSKNYPYHKITFTTRGLTNRKETVEPILNYLEQNDYFTKLKEVNLASIENKLARNNEMILQIDGVLANFSKETTGNVKNDKMFYYNENTQLNDIIGSKRDLVRDINMLEYNKQIVNKIVKESSSTVNILSTKSFNDKKEILLPILFMFIYVSSLFFVKFYKKQASIYSKKQ